MIAYRTEVFHIHPSPRGLVGDRRGSALTAAPAHTIIATPNPRR